MFRSGIAFAPLALSSRLVLLLSVAVLSHRMDAKATPGQRLYLEGVRAYDGGSYDVAERKLADAIREDPSEGLKKFSVGLNAEDYLPHCYRGLSLAKLERNEDAQKELEESERQGAVRARPLLYTNVRNALARLRSRIAQLRPTATASVPSPQPQPPPTRAAPSPPPLPTAVPSPLVIPVRSPSRPTLRPTAGPTASPLARPAASPARPPRALSPEEAAAIREGVRSFFKGEYEVARRTLEPHSGTAPVARLFVAYSLAGQELLQESRQSDVVERARNEYELARSEGAASLPELFVSPAIKSLLSGE